MNYTPRMQRPIVTLSLRYTFRCLLVTIFPVPYPFSTTKHHKLYLVHCLSFAFNTYKFLPTNKTQLERAIVIVAFLQHHQSRNLYVLKVGLGLLSLAPLVLLCLNLVRVVLVVDFHHLCKESVKPRPQGIVLADLRPV
jgi:hypothetical protein